MNEAPDHPMILKLMRDGFIEIPEPIYDIYDTELCDDDFFNGDVIENEHGELIHKSNLLEYAIEYCECKIKTR